MKTESINGYEYSREGFLLTGLEEKEISYLQTHADLVGPDPKMNKKLRAKVTNKENWQHTVSTTDYSKISIAQILNIELDENCLKVFKTIPYPSIEISKLIWKFHWINRTFNLPENSKLVCIGANPGLECVIAQTLFPKWEITGIDFRVSEKPLFKNMLQMNISALDNFFAPNSIDVCFSNHVIEHLGPTRDKTLKAVKTVLKRDGFFISALPCDANPKYLPIKDFFDLLKNQGSKFLHLINPAHMWKADIFNIHDVLTSHGFSKIDFFRYKGSGRDNNNAIYDLIPKNLLLEEVITEKKSKKDKLLHMLAYFKKVKSVNELALKWHYHKVRKGFYFDQLTPEILFCCRPVK